MQWWRNHQTILIDSYEDLMLKIVSVASVICKHWSLLQLLHFRESGYQSLVNFSVRMTWFKKKYLLFPSPFETFHICQETSHLSTMNVVFNRFTVLLCLPERRRKWRTEDIGFLTDNPDASATFTVQNTVQILCDSRHHQKYISLYKIDIWVFLLICLVLFCLNSEPCWLFLGCALH